MVYAPISVPYRYALDMPPSRRRTLLVTLLCIVVLSTFYLLDFGDASTRTTSLQLSGIHSQHKVQQREYTQTLVVASTTAEDTNWVAEALPKIDRAIYLADDPAAPLHPPQNRGHESMIYLTYIIDHYYNLSDTTIFTHAERNSWHNNDLFDFDLARMISSISNTHVSRVGYFNLRCHHESGCPDHIKPQNTGHSDKIEEPYFATVWEDLHGPNAPPLPETLAVACCSQFAASKDAILKIPLARWVHYRDWLLNSSLPDSISGRIWEFTWHYILTGQEVSCPALTQCYCDGYGLCFRDEGEIMSWLAMKEVQTLAKHFRLGYEAQAAKGEDKGVQAEDLQFHLDQRIGRPLNKWLYEAELRGRDPWTRAFLSGRGDDWVEGDGL